MKPDGIVIGLLAKTGRAVATVLDGAPAAPSVVLVSRLSLWPADLPNVGPYHTVMHLPWAEAAASVVPTARAVERLAVERLSELVASQTAAGKGVRAVGIVGSVGREPAQIPNPHIRAHAAEGQLFRGALELAAASLGLRAITLSSRDVFAEAANACGIRAASFRARIKALGAGTRPWRVEEQSAAAGAWAASTLL